MRVVLVNMTLDIRRGGGTAARTIGLASSLSASGDDVRVLTTTPVGTEAPRIGVPVHALPAVGGRHCIPVSGFAAAREILDRAEVVLLTNHWTLLNGWVWRRCRIAGRPYVVSPCGALPHHGTSRGRKLVYKWLVGGRIVRQAAGHVAVTPAELEDFAEYGVPESRPVVIPNGVAPAPAATDEAGFRRRHGLGSSRVLLFLGRLAPIKGADLLLNAFAAKRAALGEWRLVFAGPDAGMGSELRAAAMRLGVDARVHFVGFLEERAKWDALAAADLLVLPSRRELMSMAALEAGAAGRPVLVTDQCGLPEVEEVGGGWLVPASVEGLGSGLEAAASPTADLPGRGLAWKRFVSTNYSWSRVAGLHRDLFAAVTGGASDASLAASWRSGRSRGAR